MDQRVVAVCGTGRAIRWIAVVEESDNELEAGGNEPPVSTHGPSSSWTFNWAGLAALVIIASLIFVAWNWLGGSGDDGDQLSIDGTTAPTLSTETTTPRTDPPATTAAPTTTTQTTTTTTLAAEAQVLIRGEMRPCRYGADCLVASFSIDGFDEHPGRFTCIYPNSQSDFSFNDNDVEEACLTADEGDTITIEIDGIRSATISEANLDGT